MRVAGGVKRVSCGSTEVRNGSPSSAGRTLFELNLVVRDDVGPLVEDVEPARGRPAVDGAVWACSVSASRCAGSSKVAARARSAPDKLRLALLDSFAVRVAARARANVAEVRRDLAEALEAAAETLWGDLAGSGRAAEEGRGGKAVAAGLGEALRARVLGRLVGGRERKGPAARGRGGRRVGRGLRERSADERAAPRGRHRAEGRHGAGRASGSSRRQEPLGAVRRRETKANARFGGARARAGERRGVGKAERRVKAARGVQPRRQCRAEQVYSTREQSLARLQLCGQGAPPLARSPLLAWHPPPAHDAPGADPLTLSSGRSAIGCPPLLLVAAPARRTRGNSAPPSRAAVGGRGGTQRFARLARAV